MVRVGVLIGAFVAGVATALLALYVALRAAPGIVEANEVADALAVAADPSLARFPNGSVVYVKALAGPSLFEKLQSKHPSLRFKSFSERPEDNGCKPNGHSIPNTPCERNDFVKLEVLSAPTAATMLVAFGTSNTFGQVLLLKFWGRWRVLVNRAYVI
jgi:hypothetical protein